VAVTNPAGEAATSPFIQKVARQDERRARVQEGRGRERGTDDGRRTRDGVDELAVDEELGEPDLHLGHLEPLAAAPIRSRHGAAPRRAGVRRGMCAV